MGKGGEDMLEEPEVNANFLGFAKWIEEIQEYCNLKKNSTIGKETYNDLLLRLIWKCKAALAKDQKEENQTIALPQWMSHYFKGLFAYYPKDIPKAVEDGIKVDHMNDPYRIIWGIRNIFE